jgi:host factor-I protein
MDRSLQDFSATAWKLPAVARRTARRRSARVCPVLILFVFNSHSHAIFQRVSIGQASAGVFIGLANIRKLIFRAKFELPGAALLEWGQTVHGAAIWHHGVTERQETVAFGQRKSFLRDSIVSPTAAHCVMRQDFGGCLPEQSEILTSGRMRMATEPQQQSQSDVLNAARKERKRVAIFLVNGVRLVGHIESFDQYLVMLSSAAGIQAVYKHSISTIQEDTGKAFTAGSARTGAGAPRDADSKRPVAISHKRRLPTNMGGE